MSGAPADLQDHDHDLVWDALLAVRDGLVMPARHGDHPLCRRLLAVAEPRSIVVAQLGQSLDGRIATVTGASHFINGPGGIDHLHRLRALVDAVVVGVGTVVADDCRLTVRRVAGVSPARVVIDPSGRIPDGAQALADDGVRRLVIRAEGAPRSAVSGVETIHLPAPDGSIAPQDVVAALARRGLRRLLVEGGATTVSAFVAADAVDRLHVMVAPLLVGSGRPGLSLAPIRELASARRPRAEAYPLGGGDILFDCEMRTETNQASMGDGDERSHDATGRRIHADG